LHGPAGRRQLVGNPIKVHEAHPQRGMCLGRGREVLRHPTWSWRVPRANQTPPRFLRASGCPVPGDRPISVELLGGALPSDRLGDLCLAQGYWPRGID